MSTEVRKPKVLNKFDIDWATISVEDRENIVYIGRPSKWGNPFYAGRDGSRRIVVQKHRIWLPHQKELMCSLHELRGKDLLCHCAPLECHGDILLELANASTERNSETDDRKG